MLPKCHNDNVPLVNYRGKILAASKQSVIEAFDVSSSTWKEISGPPAYTIIHMAVNCDTLYVYVEKKPQSMWGYTPTLFSLTTEGWKEQDFDVKMKGSKLLLTSEHLFIETDKCIYRQKINSASESETKSDEPNEPPNDKEIVLPPYKAFTLHVLKDTLLSFGGRDEDYQPTSDVLRYNPDTDTWESAGYMRSARYNVAVATVQQDNTTEVYVLGGEFGSTKLKMKPKLQTNTESTPTGQTPANWDCSTSIVEKCILSD